MSSYFVEDVSFFILHFLPNQSAQLVAIVIKSSRRNALKTVQTFISRTAFTVCSVDIYFHPFSNCIFISSALMSSFESQVSSALKFLWRTLLLCRPIVDRQKLTALGICSDFLITARRLSGRAWIAILVSTSHFTSSRPTFC